MVFHVMFIWLKLKPLDACKCVWSCCSSSDQTSGKLHLHKTMLVLTTKTESRSQIFLNMWKIFTKI